MNTHFTMKELPDSEQPYEKCMKFGSAILTDAELLAVILRSGSKNKNALEIAHEILKKGERSLLNLCNLDINELMEIDGIGIVKAIQLKCIAELTKRVAVTNYKELVSMTEPKTVADYYMEQLRHELKEKLILAMFNGKNQLIGDVIVSVGTVNMALVSPREIFLHALAMHAVNIILIHNHPSGDPMPSTEDKRTTGRVLECGQMIGIYLVDHIIIGKNKYMSFREKGFL